MKAAVCHEFGKPLVIEDIDLAPPRAGEIKVRMAACAICHSDILFMEGSWGGTLPAVYGHEAAGVVDEIGTGVKGIAVGDHVVVTLIRSCGGCHFCSQGEQVLCETTFPLDENGPLHSHDGQAIVQGMRTGAFAEYVVVDASQAVAIPKSVPLDSASLLACGVITGLGAVVNTAGVTAGSSVVVIGTGGVGLNSVQGAALSGAQPVIAVDLSDLKLEAARTFGATHTVNPSSEDAGEAVRALTGRRGADYVIVGAGSKTAIEQGTALMRAGGTLVIAGMPPTGVTVEFDPCGIAGANQHIVGSKMGSTRVKVDVPRLVALYQQGRLKLDELISGRYPLADINEAVASTNRGEALRNVIVF